jgi:hypothetical protein
LQGSEICLAVIAVHLAGEVASDAAFKLDDFKVVTAYV